MNDLEGRSTIDLDRLWLLDRLWAFGLPLVRLVTPGMRAALNCFEPPGGQRAIPAIVAAAWRDGLVAFSLPGGEVEPLGPKDVFRWFEDGEVSVGLTASGGAVWEKAFDVDWARYVETTCDAETWQGIGLERAAVEAEVEALIAVVGPVVVVWDEVPFRPTPWKVFPTAARARVEDCPHFRMLEPDPPTWRRVPLLGVDARAAVDLAGAGLVCSASVPTELLCGARLGDVLGGEGVLQMRIELPSGEEGVLEITGDVGLGRSAWEAEGGGAVVFECRLWTGAVELRVGWRDEEGGLERFTSAWMPGARARWWTARAGP